MKSSNNSTYFEKNKIQEIIEEDKSISSQNLAF